MERQKITAKRSGLRAMASMALALGLALGLAACGHSGTERASTRPSTATVACTPLPTNTRQRLQYFYLEALRHQERGNFDAAFELFNHCLTLDPNAPEVYYALAPYYAEMKQDSVTIRYFKQAAELNPANNAYMERLAQVYINENRVDEAIETYERLYANNRERSDVLNILVQLYEYKKDYARMIDAINRIELTDGPSEKIALARMNVYERQGKQKEALNELQSLAQRHPNDMNYRVMTGNWLLRNGRKADALAEYEKVLAEEPDNTMAQMSLIDYYQADGQDSLARQLTERMLLSEHTPSDTKITLMRQLVQDNEQAGGDSVKVLQLFDRILSLPQENSDMAELMVAYMTLKQMPQELVDAALWRVVDITPDNIGARLQLIQHLWARKDYGSVALLAEEALGYTPEEMAFYYFLGLANFQMDLKDEALDAFSRGVGVINEQSDPDIVSDFFAIMGDILHDKGRAREAYAAYDSCLHYKADNTPCLNNYAYYLCEENTQLDKAEEMSYHTVKAEPNNSTFLDTYAWILFMEGRYAEARIYIDQAVQKDTTHSAVLLEHAGDIYAKNGIVSKAVELWQQAVDAGGESKVLIRKIKLRKYIKE